MVLVFETTLATYVSRTIYIKTGMVLVFETTLVTNVSSTIYKKNRGGIGFRTYARHIHVCEPNYLHKNRNRTEYIFIDINCTVSCHTYIQITEDS